MACSKQWMRRSMVRGNAPPRVSVLSDPEMVRNFGWAPVVAAALQTAQLEPREPFWATMELQLRSGISEVLLGEKTAKQALDGVRSRLAAHPAPRRDGTMSLNPPPLAGEGCGLRV